MWSLPSLSNTIFQNFQYHTKLYFKCRTLLAFAYISVQYSGEKILLHFECCFAMVILDLIARVHPASFVILLPKHLKYLSYSTCRKITFPGVLFPSKPSMSKYWRMSFPTAFLGCSKICVYVYIYIYIYFGGGGKIAPLGQGLLVHEVSRSYATTHDSR